MAQTWWGLVSKKHPHGRGEDRRYGGYQSGFLRNTPTGVGKTSLHCGDIPGMKKHPHGRGEDPKFCGYFFTCKETPPRAWGRHLVRAVKTESSRNTPTGVGKTPATPYSNLLA